MEQGLLSRMREFFDLSALSEISLLVICALIRAPDPNNLVRVSALSYKAGSKPPLLYILELLGRTDSNVARKDVCTALSALLDVDAKYVHQAVKCGAVGRLWAVVNAGCSFDVKMEAGECLPLAC